MPLTPLQRDLEAAVITVARLVRDGVRVLGVNVDGDDNSIPTVRIAADDADRLAMPASHYEDLGAEHLLGTTAGRVMVIWTIPRVEAIN